jgi:hypothetical protein
MDDSTHVALPPLGWLGRITEGPPHGKSTLFRPLPIGTRTGWCDQTVEMRTREVRFRVKRDAGASESPDHSPLGLLTAAGEVARQVIGFKEDEYLLGIFVDRRRIVGYTIIRRGGPYSVRARPADVIRPALLVGAGGIILAHNHPLGRVASPSNDDVELTYILGEACKWVGVDFIDHLVVTRDSACSLRAAVMDQLTRTTATNLCSWLVESGSTTTVASRCSEHPRPWPTPD